MWGVAGESALTGLDAHRLITIYDCKVELQWAGTASDGSEVKGKLIIPEVSHEITLDGLSDYVVRSQCSSYSLLRSQSIVPMVAHVALAVFARRRRAARTCEEEPPSRAGEEVRRIPGSHHRHARQGSAGLVQCRALTPGHSRAVHDLRQALHLYLRIRGACEETGREGELDVGERRGELHGGSGRPV